MDQPEPPGISPPADPPPRRFPGLTTPPTARRLAPSRLAIAGLLAVGAVAVLAFALSEVGRAARRYVDGDPAYRLSYRQIALDPPPPPWFRGGAAAFLDHALGRANEFQSFSALDFDRDRLLVRFRRFAWVEKALRVEVGYPNRVTVRLQYREPVAVERLEDGTDRTVVSGEGVILPREDIDFERTGPLVRLCEFARPADPRPGLFWNQVDANNGFPVRNERVREASQLAAFLRERVGREAPHERAVFNLYVHAWKGEGSEVQIGTYVQVGARLMFLWEDTRDGSHAEPVSPETRWEMLRDYAARRPSKESDPTTYLRFTRGGVARVGAQAEPRRAARSGAKLLRLRNE